VDFGAERHGFLPLKEISNEYFKKWYFKDMQTRSYGSHSFPLVGINFLLRQILYQQNGTRNLVFWIPAKSKSPVSSSS
jgi:Ribonuclease G/E